MPDEPTLSDDEREVCRLTGMSPEKYAAIRDLPRGHGGGRSMRDVTAVQVALTTPEENR